MNPPSRAVLVAPAVDERKARKALASNADLVVLDLEDSIRPVDKDRARTAATALLAEFAGARPCAVRINAPHTEWAAADLAACAAEPRLHALVLPKAERPDQVHAVDAGLLDTPIRIQLLVETALGLTNLNAICAAAARVDAVVLGYADLAADLGRSADAPAPTWDPIRIQVLIAARAAGCSVIDGPHLTIADDDGFRAAKAHVRDLGFDGTWVIHPQQVDSATATFTPSDEQLRDAGRVLAALDTAAAEGSGATQLDGRMLDEALAVAARRTLTKAGIDA